MRTYFASRNAVVAVLLLGALVGSTSVQGDTSQISALTMQRDANGSPSYIISKSGPVEIDEMLLDNPPRLVLDFLGTTHGITAPTTDGDGEFVARVRSSQFTKAPDLVTRVVFDLKIKCEYHLTTEADRVIVRFEKTSRNAAEPETPTLLGSSMAGSVTPILPPAVDEPEKKVAVVKDAAPKTPAEPAPASVAAPSSTAAVQAPVNRTPASTRSSSQPEANTQSPAPAVAQSPPAKAQPTTQVAIPSAAKPSDAAASPAAPASKPSDAAASPATPASKQPAVATEAKESGSEDNTAPMIASWDAYDEEAETPETAPNRPILTAESPSLQAFSASAGLVANRNITIDVQDADVQTVLRSFSEFSNMNIVAGPEVDGKVTAHLNNVPWRQAMDIILKAHGFAYREEYGMIRVSTIDKLTKEELEIQAAERQKDDLLPLETRIIPLSYARASEIRDALKEIKSQRGSIEIEAGMNSLIIHDIAKNIEKIEAMVKELDRKTKQVEIVAKLVDVDYDATREIGVRWDLLNLSAAGVSGVGDLTIDARSAAPVGTLRVGTVQSWGEVQAIIDMLERDNKANIISNPRIVTAENREASILVGKEIPLIVSDEAGNPITELTKIGIILRVTPHVNLDNTITLDLHPEVSDLAAQATVQGGVVIVMSEADTRVVVGDGETAVIGGLINEVESKFENGVPVLKNIPIVGGLFKLNSDTKKKRELVIFVTPKLVGA
jgi:type IV pilus assembly protein PilQ